VGDGMAIDVVDGGYEAVLEFLLDATRMWRSAERASLEKPSTRLSLASGWELATSDWF
jgi:hypothetical protein